MLRRLTQFSAWTVYFLVFSLYLFSLVALFERREGETLWALGDVAQLLQHSLLQAGISALLSTVFGVLLARSFFYLRFSGKSLLYKVVAFAWALPPLVVIFAVIGVWGKSGWLAILWHFFGWDWSFSLYGLQGILLAHLLLNIPLVARYCLAGLNLIPSSQLQLAAQLNLTGWHAFRIVEWAVLKGILPYAFLTVFLLCFTSFPIVLMLGGSPKYSTLEVAIYQAVTFEFDFAKAVMLIAVQIVLGVGLQIAMDFATRYAFSSKKNKAVSLEQRWVSPLYGWRKWGLQAVLWGLSSAIIVPLLSVIWAGVSVPNLLKYLTHSVLWESAFFSLLLSLVASFTVIIVAYLIALEARQLAYRQQKLAQSILASISTYPLIMPIFLLAVGLFLLLMDVELVWWHKLVLVGVCNGLMLLPYLYRLLFSAMWDALIIPDKLARSLGLTGIRRWWIVEKPYLIRPLCNGFALAMSASLGSFAVIAFFGSPDFSTLPYLLYQQLGSYRMEEAAVTALVLLFMAFLPFLLIEQKEIER